MAKGAPRAHKKKRKKPKAEKTGIKKVVGKKAAGTDSGQPRDEEYNMEAARKRNPKAFVFSSRGKAKVQQARSAERDQRRMHGIAYYPC